jgi:hypothetical protein
MARHNTTALEPTAKTVTSIDVAAAIGSSSAAPTAAQPQSPLLKRYCDALCG